MYVPVCFGKCWLIGTLLNHSFVSTVEVDCGPVLDLLNGSTYVNGSGHGGFVMYTCNNGYQLVGDMIRRCTALGLWSGKEPRCVSGGGMCTHLVMFF